MYPPNTRIYEVKDHYYKGNVIAWGASRYGNKRDNEMEEAVCKAADTVPGDKKTLYINFVPEDPKIKKPEHILAQRICNMKKRAAKTPLFAGQIEAEQLKKNYFTLGDVIKHQEERRKMITELNMKFWEGLSADKEVRVFE
jgi:hypothetical protein